MQRQLGSWLAIAGMASTLCLWGQSLWGQNAEPFELRDGDRVLFLGDTLIERAQRYGYWERNLTARFAGRRIIFRNLGWSADTPQGKSRASFDWSKPPEVWFGHLRQQIEQVNPTVVFLGYGMANSFEGEAGLPAFRAQMESLMDAIRQINPAARFVVLSPLRHEALGGELPDPGPHNADLARYTAELRDLAAARGAWFVSFYDAMAGAAAPFTENGIHMGAEGYRRTAEILERGLGWEPRVWEPAREPALEALREAIVRKDELYFHRWRPQNSTYLFLFRKHEQGQNAREIPMFDSLIALEEDRIARLGHLDQPLPLPVPRQEPEWRVFEQDVGTFQADPLLEVNLFAENPVLAKPIHMNFDREGRLWVASSSVYPQIEPGQTADDKILVLEDSDGDGRADRSTVFADGLLIPTGVLPGDGGVYVGQSTELLFFKDTDGDGRADEKRVVLSAFGTEDTHHILHTLRWGFDGQLYMNQSIYIHTHVETPHGVVRLNSGGILSLRPSTLELGIFMKGLVNSWGHVYDAWGQSFATDGAGTPEAGLSGISYVVPGAMYHTYAGARRILGSVSPGSYPKFCSLEILQSEHFPESWQGNLVTCDFRANRIARFQIEEKGSAYVATEMPLFLRSTNVAFRPIDVKLGPDGALYIADWSNPIIQHGEVDFRDPRRDHVHGRIWRVTVKDRPLVKTPAFAEAEPERLLDLLLSPNLFSQEQARRELTERGRGVLPALAGWTRDHPAEPARLQALWLHQSLNVVNESLLKDLLEGRDPRVRAAATRVLGAWQTRVNGGLDLLAARVGDEHPRVRMEAARALSRVPSARAAELVLGAVDREMDTHLEYALWLSINDLAQPWIKAVQSGAWAVEGREKQLEFGLNAIEPALASEVLGQLIEGTPFARDLGWISLIGKAGGPRELRRLMDAALMPGFEASSLAAVLRALEEAARVRGARPQGELGPLVHWLGHEDPAVRREAIRLAGRWKLSAAVPKLVAVAGGEDGELALRLASVESLRDIGGEQSLAALRPLTEPGHVQEIRRRALVAWMGMDARGAAPRAIEVLGEETSEDSALALWRALLGIRGSARALAAALPSTGFPPVAAKSGLRAAREGGRNEPDLVLALSRGADLDDETRTLTDAEMAALGRRASERGDPARGERVYRRAQLGCVTCHAIGGVGGQVGPDLTSIGASAPMDYVIESMLYPNRKIKEGYHSIVIETKDGDELSGILVRETSEEVFVRDVQNQEVAVSKNNLARRVTGNSLMPAGLVDYLSDQERLDLFRFLSELGKPGPFDATQGTVARYWRLAPGTIDLVQFGDDKVLQSDINGKGWWPGSALVDGRLPRAELQTAIDAIKWRDPSALYAAARLELAKAESVRFQLEGAEGLPLWVNGVRAGTDQTFDLEAGTHTIILKMDARQLPEAVRLSASAGTFLVR